MGRSKQANPMRREPSDTWLEKSDKTLKEAINVSNGFAKFPQQDAVDDVATRSVATAPIASEAGTTQLAICAIGIYTSFLTWALVQERITTTPYGLPGEQEIFDFSIFLNTVQSSFAAITGYMYLYASSRFDNSVPKLFPKLSILPPMLLVAITSSLASPFGYASLKHIGYVTFILAKSCKLLPVMALHVSVFRRRYPLYKYAVVAVVTAGVAVFTLYNPSTLKKSSKPRERDASVAWGLTLLSINLLFDGLTNSVQDYINSTFAPYSGSQMMSAMNIISTALTSSYLILTPYLANIPFAHQMGFSSSPTASASHGELVNALAFLSRHPSVTKDVLLFSACGAIGQVFIFYTLSKFSSLVLVTITVTRKMLTMLLSVVWFGHRLTLGQWTGVALVFGGIGGEALIGRAEKQKKERSADKNRKNI